MDDLNFAMITGGGSEICMKIAQGWFFHYPVSHRLLPTRSLFSRFRSFFHGPHIF